MRCHAGEEPPAGVGDTCVRAGPASAPVVRCEACADPCGTSTGSCAPAAGTGTRRTGPTETGLAERLTRRDRGRSRLALPALRQLRGGRAARVGPADQAPVVLRGTALRDAAILRLLAVERCIRGVLLVLLAYGVYAFNGSRNSLRQVFDELPPAAAPGRRPARHRPGVRRPGAADREGAERPALDPADGRGRRAGVRRPGARRGGRPVDDEALGRVRRGRRHAVFIPLEVYEIVEQVTWLRVVALALNVFAVVYLLWTKRLFGIRGGQGGLRGRAGGHLAARGRAGRRRAGAARAGAGRAQTGRPRCPQLGPQRDVVGEPDRVHPGAGGRGDVGGRVVDEHAAPPAAGRPARRSTREDRRVRLGEPLGPGHHDVLEQAEEVVAVERLREQLVGPVGQREQRVRRPRAGRAAPRRWRRSARRCSARSGRGRPRRARDQCGWLPVHVGGSASAQRRPASSRWFQARKSKSSAVRNRVASSAPTPRATAGCGSHRISTLPRSNTTARSSYAVSAPQSPPERHTPGVATSGVVPIPRGPQGICVGHFQRSDAGTKSRVRSPV